MEKQVDILIVGAGISGIGLAAHLSKHCPQRSLTSSNVVKVLAALGICLNIREFVPIRICRLLALILSLEKKACLPMAHPSKII